MSSSQYVLVTAAEDVAFQRFLQHVQTKKLGLTSTSVIAPIAVTTQVPLLAVNV